MSRVVLCLALVFFPFIKSFGDTSFQGGDFIVSGNWSNGLPLASNPGVITNSGTSVVAGTGVWEFFILGWGGQVDQTAGDIFVDVGLSTGILILPGTSDPLEWNLFGGTFSKSLPGVGGSPTELWGSAAPFTVNIGGTGQWNHGEAQLVLDRATLNMKGGQLTTGQFYFENSSSGTWTSGVVTVQRSSSLTVLDIGENSTLTLGGDAEVNVTSIFAAILVIDLDSEIIVKEGWSGYLHANSSVETTWSNFFSTGRITFEGMVLDGQVGWPNHYTKYFYLEDSDRRLRLLPGVTLPTCDTNMFSILSATASTSNTFTMTFEAKGEHLTQVQESLNITNWTTLPSPNLVPSTNVLYPLTVPIDVDRKYFRLKVICPPGP